MTDTNIATDLYIFYRNFTVINTYCFEYILRYDLEMLYIFISDYRYNDQFKFF